MGTYLPLIAQTQLSETFLFTCLGLAIAMLIWDTVEVGRNDAANLVNAVFGARILERRVAVWIAGIGVVLGATFSSKVIETARKGIFDPKMLTVENLENPLAAAFAIYTAVYIVDTVLLYSYSAFGMPVSTTACLVFELLGASFAIGLFGGPEPFEIVKWTKAGTVVSAIIMSIIISGAAGFMVQRAVRGAIRDKSTDLKTLLMHGGWIGGGMLAGLWFFLMIKGMKGIVGVKHFREWFRGSLGTLLGENPEHLKFYSDWVLFLLAWIAFGMVVHFVLVIRKEKAARLLFPVIAVVGMVCMGFAFGQNDLANSASPGLASWNLYQQSDKVQPVVEATELEINRWLLVGCGFLLLIGMASKNAQRVTRAEVNTGSMSHNVTLWAPKWCISLARLLIRLRGRQPTLAPPAMVTPLGKRMHYDPLRACVILTVSASVIATASSFGLPVSTTYVAFAAVVATGAADRILQRGDADLKLARTIWVVFSWFASALIAAIAAGCVCMLIYKAGVVGALIGVGANLAVRIVMKKRADIQEERTRQQARERAHPEEFAEPDAG